MMEVNPRPLLVDTVHMTPVLIHQTFDKIREQGGYKYPPGLERVSL